MKELLRLVTMEIFFFFDRVRGGLLGGEVAGSRHLACGEPLPASGASPVNHGKAGISQSIASAAELPPVQPRRGKGRIGVRVSSRTSRERRRRIFG